MRRSANHSSRQKTMRMNWKKRKYSSCITECNLRDIQKLIKRTTRYQFIFFLFAFVAMYRIATSQNHKSPDLHHFTLNAFSQCRICDYASILNWFFSLLWAFDSQSPVNSCVAYLWKPALTLTVFRLFCKKMCSDAVDSYDFSSICILILFNVAISPREQKRGP